MKCFDHYFVNPFILSFSYITQVLIISKLTVFGQIGVRQNKISDKGRRGARRFLILADKGERGVPPTFGKLEDQAFYGYLKKIYIFEKLRKHWIFGIFRIFGNLGKFWDIKTAQIVNPSLTTL